MARKRIIYQSEALYAGATGATKGSDGINQIHRVQDVSHSVEVTRTDVNEFGKLAALSREVIEVPTVGLDFTYYVVDGQNEASGLGFSVDGHNVSASTNCLSGIMKQNSTDAEKNYYIVTVPEGEDASNGGTAATYTSPGSNGLIGIGNGYITSYGLEASVGEIPSASVSVEASNLRFDTSSSGVPNPAISTSDGSAMPGNVEVPISNTGTLAAAALRPGDITLDFGTTLNQMGGAILPGYTADTGIACVQSVSLDLPLGRTPLQCLGSVFPKSRELDFPINATLSVSANLADISSGSLRDLLCSDASERDITLTMRTRCGTSEASKALVVEMKNAIMDSQNMSSTIGDNKTVDLTFSTQIGGPTDTNNGVFISGKL